MSYLDVSNQNEEEEGTNEIQQASHFESSMSRAPLFKISDLKGLKMKELNRAVKEEKAGNEE
jgi:hypothetical protein